MRFTKKSPPLGRPPRRVVVFRALQLGDMLCAVPAFRSMRQGWPDAEIVLIGLPWARDFAGRFGSYVDGFIEFPGWPGLPEREPQVGRIPEFLAGVQDIRFDLAVQLHGSGSFVNEIVSLFGARRCAGFARPGDHRPDSELFCPWPETGLEIHRLLALTEFLGLPTAGDHLEFPIHAPDRSRLGDLDAPDDRPTRAYVCVHPGASVEPRRWSPARFAEVADALAGRGLRIVLTGTAGEVDLCREVAGLMRHPALDLSGRTALGPLAALLGGAVILVCNDTGVSHLAAAIGLPSVVISTGENPDRWAPVDRQRHRVLCREAGVEVREVIDAALALLESADRRSSPGKLPEAARSR